MSYNDLESLKEAVVAYFQTVVVSFEVRKFPASQESSKYEGVTAEVISLLSSSSSS